MKITGFDIAELRLPLKKPFITALRRVDCVKDVIIKVHTDTGIVGYGEACAVTAITGTTNEDVVNELSHTVFPSLIHNPMDAEDIFKRLHAMNISPETMACVDIALFDLLAKQKNQSLHQFLGSERCDLQTDLTISVDEPLKMQNETLTALDEGFNILKIKLDKDIDANIERLRRINEVLNEGNTLRLDPNQSLTLDGCLKMISHIRNDNIECIEQPFAAQDLDSMKQLKRHSLIPVLADESLFNTQDALKLLHEDIADMLNIKLMKCGGIYEALKIAKLAVKYDKNCMIGSMLEGPISLVAAAHFGLSQKNITMADLDSPLYLQEHPLLKPFNMRHDTIHLKDTTGLGIDPIMNRLGLFN